MIKLFLILIIFKLDGYLTYELKENERNPKNLNFQFAQQKEITGPRCTPLVSQNIDANPYHASLMSKSNANVRYGQGMPFILDANPIYCPNDSPEPCSISFRKSVTLTLSSSYSINLGNSQTFSKSIGSSESKGQSNGFSQSMSKTLESSLTRSLSFSNEMTMSKQVSDSLTNTHERTTGLSKSQSQEVAETDSITQDVTSSNTIGTEISLSSALSRELGRMTSQGGSKSIADSLTNEKFSSQSNTIGSEIGGSFWGFSASVSNSQTDTQGESTSRGRTNTDEENWSNTFSNTQGSTETKGSGKSESRSTATSNGKSNAKTRSHQSSSTQEDRVSDAVAVSRSTSRDLANSNSKSVSDTTSNGLSYRVDDTYTSSDETSLTRNLNNEKTNGKTIGVENSTVHTHTFSFETDQMFRVNPGSCKIFVCSPMVTSMSVLFECLGMDNKTNNIFHTEVMAISSTTLMGKIQCVISLIDCQDKDKSNMFVPNIDEFRTKYSPATLEYNSMLTRDRILISKNGMYTLRIENTGNLVLRLNDVAIWENGMSFFKRNDDVRVRINEKGHLVQEAKNIFSITNYRRNEWTTVWSSVPINHNVTHGMPNIDNKVYTLVVSDEGSLHLYDTVGVLIWCTKQHQCKHNYGYKFPEVYLVPTNIITPEEKDNLMDKHNRIDSKINYLKNDSLMSLDPKSCHSILMSNQGILSKNKRFKLILEETGNLIIKDSLRTMWETASGNLSYAQSPYKLIVTPIGNLAIISSNGYMIWNTRILENFTQSTTSRRPYKMTLLNEGRLVVTDKDETEIWESWPMRNMSFGLTYLYPIEFRFVPCDGKPLNVTKMLLSDNEKENVLLENEKLISKNGLWDVRIENHSLVIKKLNVLIYRLTPLPPLFKSQTQTKLLLQTNGDLVLLNKSNDMPLWTSHTSRSKLYGPFSFVMSNEGVATIQIKNSNKSIWANSRVLSQTFTYLKSDEYFNLKQNDTLESSPSSLWNLTIKENKLLKQNKHVLFEFKTNIDELVLNDEGEIVVYSSSSKGEILWRSNTNFNDDKYKKPFKLILNNIDGSMEILDKHEQLVWPLDRCLAIGAFQVNCKCHSSFECTSKYCLNGKCKANQVNQACVYSSDCTSKNCQLGKCKENSVNGTCLTSSDCTSGNCNKHGKCEANSLNGVCLNSTDCTSENCVNGKCQANGFNGVCLTLTDCSSKNCLNGKCQANNANGTCLFWSDCTSHNCLNSICKENNVNGTCLTSLDCTSRNCNKNGKCEANSLDGTCLNSTDCTSENCLNGKCQANRINEKCQLSSDCVTNNCFNGKCLCEDSNNGDVFNRETLLNEFFDEDENKLSRANKIDLSGNLIAKIDDDTFKHLSQLESLDLSYNLLTCLNSNLFSSLTNLQRIDLHSNQIKWLDSNAFRFLVNLKYLNLDKNYLSSLHSNTFSSLINLNELWLQSNRLDLIESNTFVNIKNSKFLSIYLGGNPFKFSDRIICGESQTCEF